VAQKRQAALQSGLQNSHGLPQNILETLYLAGIPRVRTMSLSPGPTTFSREELLKVWHEVPSGFSRYANFDRVEGNYGSASSPAARQFCMDLHQAASNPVTHAVELDKLFETMYLLPFTIPKGATEEEVSTGPAGTRPCGDFVLLCSN
jgi:hypothetical protein